MVKCKFNVIKSLIRFSIFELKYRKFGVIQIKKFSEIKNDKSCRLGVRCSVTEFLFNPSHGKFFKDYGS